MRVQGFAPSEIRCMHSPAMRQVPFQCLALATAAILLPGSAIATRQSLRRGLDHVRVHVLHSIICCACYESGAGRISTTFFCTRRAAELHISRSRGWQAACKGVMSVPTVYRPSKRVEDQEAGPVGAPGAWQVRPEGAGGAAGTISYPTSLKLRHPYIVMWINIVRDVGSDVGVFELRHPYILM